MEKQPPEIPEDDNNDSEQKARPSVFEAITGYTGQQKGSHGSACAVAVRLQGDSSSFKVEARVSLRGKTTVNRGAIMAVALAAEMVESGSKLTVYASPDYVVKQLNGEYDVHENGDAIALVKKIFNERDIKMNVRDITHQHKDLKTKLKAIATGRLFEAQLTNEGV